MSTSARIARRPAAAERDGVIGPAAGALVCARCGHRITRREFLVAIDGRVAHTRTNPHGWTFSFHTFALAPGCVARGTPETAASWFPPRAWRLAHCAGCGDHLGWCFTAPGSRSYGLIDDCLREDEDA